MGDTSVRRPGRLAGGWRALVIVAIFSRLGQAQISGTIQSTDGQPLEGAAIYYSMGSTRPPFKTPPDGSFQLAAGKQAVLLITRDGYRPAIRVVTPPVSDMTVRLEPVAGLEWTIPLCSHSRPKIPWDFKEISLRFSREVRVTKYGGMDFRGYHASYTDKNGTAVLRTMTGLYATSGTPHRKWFAGLDELSVRSIGCGKMTGLDIRGKSADGLQSRRVGFFGYSFVSYEKTSASAARVFDKIIDKACCR